MNTQPRSTNSFRHETRKPSTEGDIPSYAVFSTDDLFSFYRPRSWSYVMNVERKREKKQDQKSKVEKKTLVWHSLEDGGRDI